MKILSLLFLFSHGNFIDKKQSSQFLSQRSKCGDACAKDKSQVSFMSDIYELIITYMKLFKFLHYVYQYYNMYRTISWAYLYNLGFYPLNGPYQELLDFTEKLIG